MAKQEGACVKRANQQYLDHSHAAKIRSAVCEKVEELTGIERNKEVTDKKTKFTETENVYISRVEEVLDADGASLSDDAYFPQLQEAVSAIKIDLEKATRSGGSVNNVAKKWMDQVEQLKEAGKFEVFVEKYDVKLGEDADQNDRLVGDKIRTVTLEIQKKAQAAAIAEMNV